MTFHFGVRLTVFAEAFAASRALIATGQDEACACLAYARVYRSRGVRCGQGQELGLRRPGRPGGSAAGFCTDVYEKFDGAVCSNADAFDGKESAQWCYVSSDCGALNGGLRVPGTDVSWKVCSAGKDVRLMDMRPEELLLLSDLHDVEISALARLAYPTRVTSWRSRRSLWGGTPPEPDAGDDRFMNHLRRLRAGLADDPPVLWSAPDGRPPFAVTVSGSAYLLPSVNYKTMNMTRRSGLTCIHGCRAAMRLEGQRDKDHCACLNWRQAYLFNGVSCGDGNEYALANDSKPLERSLCEGVFQRLDESFCVNRAWRAFPGAPGPPGASEDEGQWCYVSSQCRELNGGKQIQGKDVSWKTCDSFEDDVLRDKNPEELQSVAEAQGVGLLDLARLAYRPGGHADDNSREEAWRWADVRSYWRLGGPSARKRSTPDRMRILADAAESGKTLVWQPAQEGEAFAITAGQRAYVASKATAAGPEGGAAGPRLRCERGCGPSWLYESTSSRCACLPWKEVYSKRGVTCGENGHERPEDCQGLLSRISKHFCVNGRQGGAIARPDEPSGQWCYVHHGCKGLHGGARVPGANASWKFCGEADHQAKDKAPDELADYAEAEGLDFQRLARLAYPTRQLAPQKALAALRVPGWENGANITEEERALVLGFRDQGEPVLWAPPSEGETPGPVVTSGAEAFMFKNFTLHPIHH